MTAKVHVLGLIIKRFLLDEKAYMDIKAFKGYRYDPSVVQNAGRCIAPPYDVIDADQQQRLYAQNDYNIVRITRGMTQPGDNESDNVYTRAAQFLKKYLADGALKQDAQESIYVYRQEFEARGHRMCRTGFVALGKLEGYGGTIKPHEQTLAGPKTDRLNLMRTTKAQTGQIFMLYDDGSKTIDAILDNACLGKELTKYADEDGVLHQLFAITDAKTISQIHDFMRQRQVFIADGHHRYETANTYFQETHNPSADYHLMTFINTHNEGLVVLPTHRLIKNIHNFSVDKFLGELKSFFDVARLAFANETEKTARQEVMALALDLEFEENQHAFGMYFGDGAFYVATLREVAVMDEVAGDHSEPWRQLDVAILHKLILEKMLGIGEAALAAETNVEYIKDFKKNIQKAVEKVDKGEGQGLFFMNPTRAQEIEAVAAHGERMPQKSTFFYPKIFSGLVLNLLD